MPRLTCCILAAIFAVPALASAGETVWIEGEASAKHSFQKHGWYDDVKKDVLSGGAWLSHYAGKPAEASYPFKAAEAAEYTLWVRCNNIMVTQHYKLDNGEWTACDFKAAEPREEMMISPKPDHRNLAWHKLGKLKLAAGDHTLSFKLSSQLQNHGGIDCFALTSAGFVPSGARKPGGSEPPAGATGPLPAGIVWVEGEAPAKHTFVKHGWYDDVKKDVLSGGNWLSHYGGQPGEASYKVTADAAGDYTLWARCNNLFVTQHYKLDDGEWTACDFKAAEPREEMMISPKPDHRNLAWHKLGVLKMTAGEHTVSFKLSSQLSNHGGLDCFVLARTAFTPSGAKRPVAITAAARGPGDWFEVIPDDDSFSAESIIDLSKRIEKPAGARGFVTRQGPQLVIGGKPVKFWGLGANIQHDKSRAWQTQWIRYLTKHGVNMVRQHTVMEHLGPLTKDGFNQERLDQWDWWCAELKKHGVYMTWSLCYPHVISREDGYDLFDDLPPHHGNANLRSTSGMATIEPALQESEWKYLKALLEHKNPYTGLRYIADPALAVVEIRNEDSIFWHAPLNLLADGKGFPKHAARLKQRWAEWLTKKYGTDEALRAAWGAGMRKDDALKNTDMGIYAAWRMGAKGPAQAAAAETKREGDLIQFLAETQRNGYERREKLLRELGYKAVTVTTAWRAGGAAADAANTWSDDAMGMIDRHNYHGGGAGGHGIAEGKVENTSHLGTPGGGLLAIGLYQVEDKPFSVTEWTQLPPNQWKAEAAPLMAFYGFGLQGWDASYHFLSSRNRQGAGWPNMSSYVTDTPHYMGQFPALALAVQRCDIQEAPIAAARRLKLDALFQGIDALEQDFTGGGYDNKAVKGNLATPAEVLAIGRVTSKFAADAAASEKVDWTKSWDESNKVLTSLTGELKWDYGKRIVTVAAPRTHAVLGFAAKTRHELPAATIEVLDTPFVSLTLTALDDQPLAQSKHILITAMARDRQTGTEYNADGTQLLKAGGPPLWMEPVQAKLTLKGPPPKSVKVVDLYGVPTSQSVPVTDGSFAIDGRYATYYYEVRR